MPAKPNPPQEVELKLEVAPSELEKVLAHPLLGEWSDGASTQTLHSTYFDTSAHALQQAGISLRVRRNGGSASRRSKPPVHLMALPWLGTNGNRTSTATVPIIPSQGKPA